MVTKPQSRKKTITVKQVGWAALSLAIVGGIYGFFTSGLANMIMVFFECLVAGFILIYIGSSFIELLRK